MLTQKQSKRHSEQSQNDSVGFTILAIFAVWRILGQFRQAIEDTDR
jgi:hypothetical protein